MKRRKESLIIKKEPLDSDIGYHYTRITYDDGTYCWITLNDRTIGTKAALELEEEYQKLLISEGSVEEHKCKHIKRQGESCTLNNQCTYPKCEIKNNQQANRGTLDDWKTFIETKYGKIDWNFKSGVINSNLFIGMYDLIKEFFNQDNPVASLEERLEDYIDENDLYESHDSSILFHLKSFVGVNRPQNAQETDKVQPKKRN